MRASRLLSILIVLQARGRVSAEALARELEVSVRTIYRDIDQLGTAGVPVYAERGRHGGFALLGGYRTDLTGLDSDEAGAVSLIGAAQAAMDLGLGADATAARLKILASLPLGGGKLAERIAARFHLDPRRGIRAPTPPPALRRACRGCVVGPPDAHDLRELEESRDAHDLAARPRDESRRLVRRRRSRTAPFASIESTRFANSKSRTSPPRARATSISPPSGPMPPASFETRLRGERRACACRRAGVKLLRDVNPAAADAVGAQHPTPARQ